MLKTITSRKERERERDKVALLAHVKEIIQKTMEPHMEIKIDSG